MAAGTERSILPWSCHCHAVLAAGCQQPLHGIGFGSCVAAMAGGAYTVSPERSAAIGMRRLIEWSIGWGLEMVEKCPNCDAAHSVEHLFELRWAMSTLRSALDELR